MTQLQKIIGNTFLYLSDTALYPFTTNCKSIENYDLKIVAQIIINANQLDFLVSHLTIKTQGNKYFGIESSKTELELLQILNNI